VYMCYRRGHHKLHGNTHGYPPLSRPSHTLIHAHVHTLNIHTSIQTVAANMSGELHLRMEAEDVTATTYFKDLQNHQFGRSIFVVLVAML